LELEYNPEKMLTMKTNNACSSALAATMIATTAPAAGTFRVYFGTTAKDDSRGIYMSRFDASTGQLDEAVRVSDSIRPGFIVIHPDGQHLYATEATGSAPEDTGGFVSVYCIEEPAGTLKDLNTQPSGGLGPCHISIHPTGTQLLVANYRGGSCAVLPILADGSLGAPTAIRRHSGSGPNRARQAAAHTHSFNCTPDGKFALAADLGIDKILIYRLCDGSLTSANPSFISTAPGAGPRHLTFSPDGKFAYVCMELNGTVTAYSYKDGHLTEIQTLSTLPDDFEGENTTSEVCFTPDGRFLYVGNRGHESLAIFERDPASGKLTALGYELTRGKHPRHFNIDPTGTFLIAANMYSDNVVVFRIDPETGQLAFTGNKISISSPSCVQFFKTPK
jgi:6-phosphogluconolactonase